MADKDTEFWTRDWRRLRRQKTRNKGGVEAGMLRDLLLYHGETQSVQVQNMLLTRAFKQEKDKNKLRLVIPLARRLADRKIGRHWSIAHKYRATPNTKDPMAFDLADVVGEQLIPAIDYRLQQDTLRWLIYFWQVVCGVAFEHVDYKEGVTQDVLPVYDETTQEMLWEDTLTGAQIPKNELEQLLASGYVQAERFKPVMEVQETGEVCGDIYDPFRVFAEASIGQVKKLGPDQRIFLADLRSIEWCKDTFGNKANGLEPSKDLSILETKLMDRGIPVNGLNLKDMMPVLQGSQDKDDPDMVMVLTMYQPTSKTNPKGIRAFVVPDQMCLDKDENPYPEVPVVDYHWGPPGPSLWTTGFMRDLEALSKFINKRFSQLGEAANAQIYEMLLLGGDLTAKDIPTDFPGVVKGGLNDETGMPNVAVVPRGNLPSFFPESIRLSMETLDQIGGSDMLSQRKFPGQLRGSLTIPMIQEIIDSEDGPRFAHLAEQFALEKMMRVNRIKQFYPPIRTMAFTGEDMRSEVLEFHNDEILRAGVDFTITVDPGSILPELSAMREARVRELFQWAPGIYTSPRTGQIDWTALATDLKYNYRQRESIATQGRKLARQLIQWCRKGRLIVGQGEVDPKTGQPQNLLQFDDGRPFVIFPFWDHNSMMDEYEAVMQTTEFIEASPPYQRVMLTLRERHREILGEMDAARQSSIENKMVQQAVAQSSQQAAAKAASTAADAAIQAVMAQQDLPGGMFGSMEAQMRQMVGGAQGAQPTGPGGPPPAAGGGRVLAMAPGGKRQLNRAV